MTQDPDLHVSSSQVLMKFIVTLINTFIEPLTYKALALILLPCIAVIFFILRDTKAQVVEVKQASGQRPALTQQSQVLALK